MIEEFADCGLDGKDDAPVKVGAFNRLLRRVAVVHLVPRKAAEDKMHDHVEACARMQAKMAGGITVLLIMVPVATGIVVGLVLAVSKKWFGL